VAAGGRQSARAQIVAPAFEHGGPIVTLQGKVQVRDVLVDELVLKVDRVRGDQHSLPISGGPLEAWDQIGHRLSGPSPGFDEQMAAFRERMSNRFQHSDLLGAVLVGGKGP
jgi:hypothetical protein